MKCFNKTATPVYIDGELREAVMNVASKNGQYVDVYVQDSNSKIIDFYFTKLLNNCTLSADTILDSYTITLDADHGVTAGEYICLQESSYASQFKVVNVNNMPYFPYMIQFVELMGDSVV